MRLIVTEDYARLSETAAEIFAAEVLLKPESVLGLATGSTPVGMYKALARKAAEEGIDFSRVTTFNLDEYRGLSGDHPQSYRYFMEQNLAFRQYFYRKTQPWTSRPGYYFKHR